EQPTGGGDPTAIMYSLYTGVKRELTPPDIGGLAYLYRPRWGDVDADGAITIADWFNAFRFVAGIAEADPYDVNILDYGRRNGLVELDEFSIFNGWVGGDVVYPFRVSIHTPPGLPLGATEITLRLEPRPIDIGLGGAVTVDLYVDNPNGRNVRGFDVELAYDPAVFSNPSVSYASLFPGGLDLPPDATTGGVVRFGQVATFEIPDTIEGLAASITFQIDLPAAVLADAFRFDVLNAIVPVTMPSIHNFGIDPCCPDETLIFLPALGFTNDYDVNGSGAIDLEDLYDFESTFVDHDVDQDGDRDQADRETLLRALRDDEQADSLTIPGG
ncbi:MAG: cohesin domain-containing protein, partial [Planctomycetota bacterium]